MWLKDSAVSKFMRSTLEESVIKLMGKVLVRRTTEYLYDYYRIETKTDHSQFLPFPLGMYPTSLV